MCRVEKPQLTHDVLAYMFEHQDAQDTLEGIIEWWLVEQEVKHQIVAVKEVIAELVEQGLIIQHRGPDSRHHYRVNRSKEKEILALLAQPDQESHLALE